MEDDVIKRLMKVDEYSGERHPEYPKTIQKIKNPQVLFSWKAPLRAYKKRSAGILRFYFALALLLTLIALFLREPMLSLPIWTSVFLVYVLTITPPPIVENKVTKFGIEIAGIMYRWEYFSHFYFVERFDYKLLVLVGSSYVYAVTKKEETRQKLIHLLSEHIIYQEHPQKTFTEKMAEALTNLMSEPAEAPEKIPVKREGFGAVSEGPVAQSL